MHLNANFVLALKDEKLNKSTYLKRRSNSCNLHFKFFYIIDCAVFDVGEFVYLELYHYRLSGSTPRHPKVSNKYM